MYKIDTEYFKIKKQEIFNTIIKICLYYSIIIAIVWIANSNSDSNILIFFIELFFHNIIVFAVVYFGMHPLIKNNNEIIKKCEYLEENGVLYHLPFKAKVLSRRTKDAYEQYVKIEVNYELPSGNQVILLSDKEYNIRIFDDMSVMSGLVDCLIDPNDYKTYYIDFNIGENPS